MHKVLGLLLLIFAASALGCSAASEASQGQLAAEGRQFLLPDEPSNLVGILEFRETGVSTSDDLVLFGRIGDDPQTWSTTSAEFLLTDPSHQPAAGAHACTSDNCPFCKDKQDASAGTAIVMLTAANGQVPKVDPRRLLPLTPGQLVVVRGPAEVNAIGQLVIHARGLYIRE